MKIKMQVDVSPEELRRLMGLPDVGGVQEQLLEQFSKGIAESDEQRDEFLRTVFGNVLGGAMSPWQNLFDKVSAAAEPLGSRRER